MNAIEKYIFDHLENDVDVYSRTYMKLGCAIGDGKIPPMCYIVHDSGVISVHESDFRTLFKGREIELTGRPGDSFTATGERDGLRFEAKRYRVVPLGKEVVKIKEVVE